MHRVLFDVGGHAVYSYGVMMILGGILGVMWILRQAPRTPIPRAQAGEALIWAIALGVVCGRIGFVLAQSPARLAHPASWFEASSAGLSSLGAFAGLGLGVWFLSRRLRVHAGEMLDLFAPGVMLGLAVGRLGCFLHGCCYGRACDLPWALAVPPLGDGVGRHPYPLYEALAALAIWGGLAWHTPRRSFRGEVFLSMLGLYAGARLVLEFFREGATLPGGLMGTQYAGLVVCLVSGVVIVALRNRRPALAPSAVVGKPRPSRGRPAASRRRRI